MTHAHDHDRSHAVAAGTTLSLLRLSAWQRLAGAGAVCAALWALVLWNLSA
jgi:hypothetical protein